MGLPCVDRRLCALALQAAAMALLASCDRCASSPRATHSGNEPSESPKAAANPAQAPTAVPAARDPKMGADAEARAAATALLEIWKTAQNEGDPTSYFALYEPKEFKGLKRTHRGKVAKFDFVAWRKDRGAMFAKPFEVSVEDPQIETWLDPKSKLKPGLTSVRFQQRWRSKTYADHGPKSLMLWRHPKTGQNRIVFEELLLSRPGWDEQSAGEGLSFPALGQAATVEEMTAALRGAQLNMRNAFEAGSEAEDPFHRGMMLQALAAMGPLDCIAEITYEQCGEPDQDWGEVEEATLDHACVRRAAVLPLLDGPPLPLDALEAAAPALTAVLDYPERGGEQDPELGEAILKAVVALPEARRLPFLAAALKHPEWDEIAKPGLAPLQAASLYSLWEEAKNPIALAPLDAGEHAAKLAAIQANADLPTTTMLPVVAALAAKNERELLAQLAVDSDCELAMAAADGLATLGDGSKLPTWKGASDAEAGKRAICMLRHDSNRARADAELRQFFHPTRKARNAQLREVVNDFGRDPDAEEPPPPSEEELKEIATATELVQASEVRGDVSASVSTIETADPDLLRGTRVFDTKDEADYDVLELFEEAGHVYLDHIGTYSYEWIGCPC